LTLARALTNLVDVRKLAAMALMLALGCSDETKSSASGHGSGGTGPSGTEPRGGVNTEIFATPEQSCPPGNVHLDVGNLKTNPPEKEVDGFAGASIACSVVPMGESFAASGEIAQGDVHFRFGDLTTKGDSATGSVSFESAGVRYASTTAKPCVFQFAPSTEQAVSAGSLWVQFDCSSLVSDADASKACSSRNGYLLVENCGK